MRRSKLPRSASAHGRLEGRTACGDTCAEWGRELRRTVCSVREDAEALSASESEVTGSGLNPPEGMMALWQQYLDECPIGDSAPENAIKSVQLLILLDKLSDHPHYLGNVVRERVAVEYQQPPLVETSVPV